MTLCSFASLFIDPTKFIVIPEHEEPVNEEGQAKVYTPFVQQVEVINTVECWLLHEPTREMHDLRGTDSNLNLAQL